jgi:hypothetical protein
VSFALRGVLPVQAKKVATVEAVEDTIPACGKLQLLVVSPLNHPGFLSRDHVHPAGPQRLNQAAIPGVLVDVQQKHQAA